jgi:hypothetical protein
MCKMCVCVFIWVNAHTCLSICACTVFLKKKIPQISYKGFPGLLAYVSTVVCLIIHNSNKKILFRTEFVAAFHFAGSGMELMEDRWQGDVSSGLILG